MNPVITKYRWRICSLIFFATTINYLDRAVISLLKNDLEKTFNWTETDYANIVIAFQVAYALGLIITGRIIDKTGTKLGYFLSIFLWSVAAIGHALVRSTAGFMIARAALGITEAGNFPSAIKAVAEWFPKKERAFATGIFNSGTNIGAILAPLTVPWIAVTWGWKYAFIITGATGFIWLIFWFLLYEVPAKHKKLSAEEFNYIHADVTSGSDNDTAENGNQKLQWMQLLNYKQTWAFILGKFLTDPVWWFYLFWLPAFLKAQYGITGTSITLPVFLVYTMSAIGSLAGGFLPLYLVKKGWPLFRARKRSMLLYALCVIPVVFAQLAGSVNMWYAVLIIGLAAAAHQAWSANMYTTVSDMFPNKVVASVTGIGGMAGAVGGILIAKAAGSLFDHFKALGQIETGYYIMFFVCGAAYVLAWGIMHLLVHSPQSTVHSKAVHGPQ
jgi:ACS family hexuronate transporter-like MFS transporter